MGHTKYASVESFAEPYENLRFNNAFIFGKVMEDVGRCTKMLQILTGNEINNVEELCVEKAVRATDDSKGVRYDVYIDDGQCIYGHDKDRDIYKFRTLAEDYDKRRFMKRQKSNMSLLCGAAAIILGAFIQMMVNICWLPAAMTNAFRCSRSSRPDALHRPALHFISMKTSRCA